MQRGCERAACPLARLAYEAVHVQPAQRLYDALVHWRQNELKGASLLTQFVFQQDLVLAIAVPCSTPH